jgi:predicted nucleic acid-binding protein
VRIPERVRKEVNLPGSGLHGWLERHPQVVITFTLPHEEDMYLYLLKEHSELDDGEAQAISIAYNRRWILVTEDAAARRVAERLSVQWISVQQLLTPPSTQLNFFEKAP